MALTLIHTSIGTHGVKTLAHQRYNSTSYNIHISAATQPCSTAATTVSVIWCLYHCYVFCKLLCDICVRHRFHELLWIV